MIGILCWIIEVVVGASTISAINIYTDTSSEGIVAIIVVYGVVTFMWGSVTFFTVLESITKQISGYCKLTQFDEEKKSYQTELTAYKDEMKKEIIKFKIFEERLMKNISDSKIIATIVGKSGYGPILQSYDANIRRYVQQINYCDREKAKTIAQMQARQSNIFVSGYFIPKKYHITSI